MVCDTQQQNDTVPFRGVGGSRIWSWGGGLAVVPFRGRGRIQDFVRSVGCGSGAAVFTHVTRRQNSDVVKSDVREQTH